METKRTAVFSKWMAGLRDHKAKARIIDRILRMEQGNMGDVKSLGDGVSEARIHFGPGYRLYFTLRGEEVIILLVGGSKKSQTRDIKEAKEIAKQIP